MNNQERIVLRLSLIMKRMGQKGAVGDAERTAKQFANRLRAVSGAFIDLAANVGKQFLPLAKEVATVLIDFANTAGPGLNKAAKGIARSFRIFLGVINGIIIALGTLIRLVKDSDIVLLTLSATALALAISFKKVGVEATRAALKTAALWLLPILPFVLLGAAVLLIIDDLQEMGRGGKSVSGQLIKAFQSIGPKIREELAELKDDFFKWFFDIITLSDKTAEKISSIFSVIPEFFKDVFGEVTSGVDSPRPIAQVAAETLQSIASPTIGVAGAAARSVVSPQGGASMINQPRTNISIEVNASGANASAQDIGSAVAREVRAVQERQNRQQMQAFNVQMSSP